MHPPSLTMISDLALGFHPEQDPPLFGSPYAPPKEGNTHPLSDDYYIKSTCPSGGHDRGHRPAIQNRVAARHVPLTINSTTCVTTT